MIRLLLFAAVCILVAIPADYSAAGGRWRRCATGPECPRVACPNVSRCYSNPCICPQDALMSYYTGSSTYTLYSTLVHQCPCKYDTTPPGACTTPTAGYLTSTGLDLHQYCEQVGGCKTIPLTRADIVGLGEAVESDYSPDNPQNNDPKFVLPGLINVPHQSGSYYISFEPKPGASPILAKLFHAAVPRHTHASNGPKYNPYLISFGFECKPGGPQPAEHVPFSSGRIRNREVEGKDLYHVTTSEGITYGIVAVKR